MLQLIRDEFLSHATFGRFRLDGAKICHSLELPWLNNQPRVSCIPPGPYKLRVRVSWRFGLALEVMDVEGRTHILVHPANEVAEILGCIAPGMRRHPFVAGQGVAESRKALAALCKALAGTGNLYGPWDLEIINEGE